MNTIDRPTRVAVEAKIDGKPVTFSFIKGEFECDGLTARNFAGLQIYYERRAEEREREAEERAAKKAFQAAPVPVSVVLPGSPSNQRPEPTGIRGDYQLTGWHKTHSTPLLRMENSSATPGFSPSGLGSAVVMHRLSAEEWAQYDNLLAAYWSAQLAYDNEGRKPAPMHTSYDMSTGEIIAGEGYRDDHYGRFPVRLEGTQVVVDVNGEVVVSEDIYQLQTAVEYVLHPDNDMPAVSITASRENGATAFRETFYHRQNTPYGVEFRIGTTARTLQARYDEVTQTKAELKSWVTAHKLPGRPA